MTGPLPPLLLRGDCIEQMRRIPDASIDAIVTDPPYGLSEHPPTMIAKAVTAWTTGDREHVPNARGFMGREWDAFVPPPAVWDEALRVLKPGGHLLAFAGSRTLDLMGLSIRLAGFEIRDSIAWLYGSGFPKSLDVSKAIDKAAGAEREVIGRTVMPFRVDNAANRGTSLAGSVNGDFSKQTENGYRYTEHSAPATPDAERWQGWGTALKPAFEPIVVARKPLIGTVAANVLAHGTGALNIDATRIGTDKRHNLSASNGSVVGMGIEGSMAAGETEGRDAIGRWPANVVLDESQAAALDEQSGVSTSRAANRGNLGAGPFSRLEGGGSIEGTDSVRGHDDSGGASRFFYVAKAPKSERPVVDGVAHPTVKPLALMRWLIRLVTPYGGVVLDPFAGSGTTLEAAYLEGMESIGCELTPDFWPLIEARIERVTR